MTYDSTIMRGEVVGADFSARDDGRIVVHVAVDAEYGVSQRQVAVIDADYFDSTLPKVQDILGIWADPPAATS